MLILFYLRKDSSYLQLRQHVPKFAFLREEKNHHPAATTPTAVARQLANRSGYWSAALPV